MFFVKRLVQAREDKIIRLITKKLSSSCILQSQLFICEHEMSTFHYGLQVWIPNYGTAFDICQSGRFHSELCQPYYFICPEMQFI